MNNEKVAKELVEISKMLMAAKPSSREVAKTLSALLGKKVSGGVAGRYPIWFIAGEKDRVIIEKDGKFYFSEANDEGNKLKLIKLSVN